MKRVYSKVFLTAIALLVSATMIMSVSYAWMVLSQNPAVSGISVVVGGSKTILLAPDLTQTVTADDGTVQTLHYPGAFSDTLNFSACDTYDYLAACSGLTPVSTADGRYWMIPEYDENGNLRPLENFSVDSTLQYANKSGGRYVYLDFWVVSPTKGYDLRVSMDKQTLQNSYLVELPGVASADDGGLTLAEPQNIVSASARVGFLVNKADPGEAVTAAYRASPAYDDRCSTLRGVYADAGQSADDTQSVFTIYEPNGTLHPAGGTAYTITKPLGYDPENNKIQETDVQDRLTVQQTSRWKTDANGQLLEQAFQTAIVGHSNLTPRAAETFFYKTYLQGRIDTYLSSGLFFQDTTALYQAAEAQASLADVPTAGTSDGAVITTLEKSTPQRIRMFIWMEGQDADCQNNGAVSASNVALRIELAGSTQ